MPPKKAPAGKKGKAAKTLEKAEPEHSREWGYALTTGIWERSPQELPDVNLWPTWGALREQVLCQLKHIAIVDEPTVRNAFVAELNILTPPLLVHLDLRGCVNLTRVVLSPYASCPRLKTLRLGRCSKLESVLVQSSSLLTLSLAECPRLSKVVLHCPQLREMEGGGCPALATLLLLSEALTSLDLAASQAMRHRLLRCPALEDTSRLPPLLPPAPRYTTPEGPPIDALLKARYRQGVEEEAASVCAQCCIGSLPQDKTPPVAL